MMNWRAFEVLQAARSSEGEDFADFDADVSLKKVIF